jgi:hypothetical protein
MKQPRKRLGIVLMPALVIALLVGPLTSAARASTVPLGDYSGADNPDAISHFASVTGAHFGLATDYLTRSSGWSGLSSANGISVWRASGYQLVLGVPLLPSRTRGSLAKGARGLYNSYFVTLARNLVTDGEASAYVRLGWEFNGTWFKWRVRNARNAGQFAAYFRNAVTAMRSVPGEAFKFIWNPNAGSRTSYQPAAVYPGDAYVDYIGTDVYDSFWGSPFTQQAAWANQLAQPWGLDWLAGFAAQHNKPIGIPEWGVAYRADGHGLGDDPYFVDQFASWLSSHGVAFANMFTYDTSNQHDDIIDGSFPNALAAFESNFG